ncbi:hypothetical protein [Parasphingopyxis sp.]|uniref:hypothetical protein n=1 Tax=Parasphingopyxis sp. TaxID=1920299 RepID=UPI002610C2A8|nr:hypothetical protein [Parasphingopyxis sp.]
MDYISGDVLWPDKHIKSFEALKGVPCGFGHIRTVKPEVETLAVGGPGFAVPNRPPVVRLLGSFCDKAGSFLDAPDVFQVSGSFSKKRECPQSPQLCKQRAIL